MKRELLIFTLGAAVLSGPLCAETNDEPTARNAAYSVAGAFTNDGFSIREGHWTGRIEVGKPKIVQVNLYAGNQYWFSIGTTPAAKKVSLSIYDETGKPLPSEPYADNGKAAAGFSPEASGPYFVKVDETEGDPCTFCLLYS